MIEKLDYAENTMEGAALFEVYDGATGRRLFNVVEANAKGGWRRQIVMEGGRRARGPDGRQMIERVWGPVEILRHVEDPALGQMKLDRAAEKRARRAAKRAAT